MSFWTGSHLCSTLLNIFSSETAGPIKVKFLWSLHGMGEWKFVQTVQVTWPRWPPCPYMVKTLKNLLRNQKTLKVGMQHQMLEYYQICLNHDPRLTLTYFTARSNFVPYAFIWEKGFFRNYCRLWFETHCWKWPVANATKHWSVRWNSSQKVAQIMNSGDTKSWMTIPKLFCIFAIELNLFQTSHKNLRQ